MVKNDVGKDNVLSQVNYPVHSPIWPISVGLRRKPNERTLGYMPSRRLHADQTLICRDGRAYIIKCRDGGFHVDCGLGWDTCKVLK